MYCTCAKLSFDKSKTWFFVKEYLGVFQFHLNCGDISWGRCNIICPNVETHQEARTAAVSGNNLGWGTLKLQYYYSTIEDKNNSKASPKFPAFPYISLNIYIYTYICIYIYIQLVWSQAHIQYSSPWCMQPFKRRWVGRPLPFFNAVYLGIVYLSKYLWNQSLLLPKVISGILQRWHLWFKVLATTSFFGWVSHPSKFILDCSWITGKKGDNTAVNSLWITRTQQGLLPLSLVVRIGFLLDRLDGVMTVFLLCLNHQKSPLKW